MKSFTKFLLEFPHYMVRGGDIAIDLELEMKAGWPLEDVIQYLRDVLDGKRIPLKTPDRFQQLPTENSGEAARKMLLLPFLRNWVLQNYGEEGWNEIESLIRSYI